MPVLPEGTGSFGLVGIAFPARPHKPLTRTLIRTLAMHLDARGHTPSPSGVGRRVAAPSAIRREPDPTAPAEKTAFLDSPVNEAGPRPIVEQMQVVRWNIPNRHLIQCARAGGECVFVRVTSNQHFRERMSIRAQLDSDGWTLVGRCPRFPGRW